MTSSASFLTTMVGFGSSGPRSARSSSITLRAASMAVSSVAAMPKRSSLTRGRSPGIDHSHAAAIPLAGQTAWQGLFRHGRLEAGQSFLIHGGSGGVGHFAIQFAKAKGAHVYTTVSTANVARRIARRRRCHRLQDAALRRSRVQFGIVFDLIDGETR